MVSLEDSVVMNFKVDGLGFRRMKEVVGQGQTWFVYDLGESDTPGLAPLVAKLVAKYDQNGNLVAKYHHDGGGLMAMTRNNLSYWYGFEAIGTVRQMMGGQGQVSDTYAFDAWGNELTSPHSPIPNPFKYVGKHGYYLDTESALMLLGVRYYGAANGLFLSRDLIKGYGYTYATNNPLGHIDPDGTQPRKLKRQLKCPPRDPRIPPLGRCDPKKPPWGPNCPQPDPNAPELKPTQCDIYLNCCNKGYVYCCNAYEAYRITPNDPDGANYVRGCLQYVVTKLPKGRTIADQSCECLY